MGRIHTAIFKGIALTAVQDLFEIAGPADAITIVHEWEVGQTTELGDAAEEELLLTCNRGVGSVTSGSGGATVTPQPNEDGDSAFGGTVERNNTTIMAVGSGTLEELDAYVWNVRQAFKQTYTPETRPVISPSNRFTLELESAPADSITVSGRIVFEEVGG